MPWALNTGQFALSTLIDRIMPNRVLLRISENNDILKNILAEIKKYDFRYSKIEKKVKQIDIKDILHRYNDILTNDNSAVTIQDVTNLFKKFGMIKKFYKKVMTNSSPLQNKTVASLIMQHYIFISYLQNNQIVRQFMTKKNATYKERFLSFLPIGNLHFKSNKCLTQLATNNKPNFICDENKSVRQTLKENIYYIEHQFETGKDKMLSINQAGLLEIYCSNSKVLNTIEIFSIFVISDNCNLYFNSMLLFRATTNQTGKNAKLNICRY